MDERGEVTACAYLELALLEEFEGYFMLRVFKSRFGAEDFEAVLALLAGFLHDPRGEIHAVTDHRVLSSIAARAHHACEDQTCTDANAALHVVLFWG